MLAHGIAEGGILLLVSRIAEGGILFILMLAHGIVSRCDTGIRLLIKLNYSYYGIQYITTARSAINVSSITIIEPQHRIRTRYNKTTMYRTRLYRCMDLTIQFPFPASIICTE